MADTALADQENLSLTPAAESDMRALMRCYSALGFKPTDFPPDAPLQDVTYYMTCKKHYNSLHDSNIDSGKSE